MPKLRDILFSDTVGFISNLPTQLVESFKATLDDLGSADLLLHVVDISDKDHRFKVQEVNKILKELDGIYSYFSILRFIIPISLSDFIYDIVSKNRYNIMGKRNFYKIPNEEEKTYFL